MNRPFRVLKLTAALSLFSAAAMSYQADKTYQFILLHFNDLHGHYWHDKNGQYGLAAQKTAVDRIRNEVEAKGGSVITLFAGDLNTGVPESDLQNAHPDIDGLNAIGYDAMVLGNHEFDNPLQLLDMQEKWAKFPFLAANIYHKNTDKTLVKPYTMLKRSGLNIAIVGLTTEDTAKLGNPEYMKDLRFDDPTSTAKKVVAEIDKQENPDVKIALTHMGYYYDGNYGSNAPGDVTMARRLEKGTFDVIVGGHSHDTVCVDAKGVFIRDYQPTQACKPDYQNGTWIMSAGEWGKFLGRADFEFKNGEVKLVRYELIPINLKKKVETAAGKTEYQLYGEQIPQDEKLLATLKTYQDKGDQLLSVKIGDVAGKLVGDRNIVRFHQTNLGRLVAEAQRQAAGADVGIMNSGGIRDSIQSGVITYRDILKVQPFGNIVSYFELSGAELIDYLNIVALKEVDSGAYPQFSGISMIIDRAAKQVKEVKIQGEPINLSKTYRISLPNYNALGGDGYPVMDKNPTYVNTYKVDAEVLKAFIAENSPIDANKFEPKGEITYR
ncbi:bifunctional UDP-sugar hydrolase/5'-nucleotidase UshA [Basfia succiniciproducens]|uniref:bifunctional UDP-sugar hydrolase/5'-nucleotidase UshA n=1 Tax=Basfia succiniciproducens TaxID=653940 RepID=UPI0008C73810|nr:bifunctional UDP-sugar hydrolase/5'-nucleotidase UshA [Basfia succiniciproducens]SEQ35478.1 5'-nucleotidase / UDP-sugar diphosphatase [Basfia succiniciproducens]